MQHASKVTYIKIFPVEHACSQNQQSSKYCKYDETNLLQSQYIFTIGSLNLVSEKSPFCCCEIGNFEAWLIMFLRKEISTKIWLTFSEN